MKLFYYQPDRHTLASLFVVADNITDAVTAINKQRETNNCHYLDRPYTKDDLQVAEPGAVVMNDNS